MEKEIRILQFFQGGSKGPGELGGQFTDKAHCVIKDGVLVVGQIKPS